MQDGHSAFLGSEYVRVRAAPALAALRERYTTDSPISLHTVFPESMAKYAGERVQITDRTESVFSICGNSGWEGTLAEYADRLQKDHSEQEGSGNGG